MKKNDFKNYVNPIVIAMICDEKFATLTKNCIRTIIATKKQDVKIRFYIIGVELSENSINKFTDLETDDIEIKVLNNKDEYLDVAQTGHRVSSAALFKFQLPNLIIEDKCLYMDGDIAVLDDLSDLFNTDIEDKYAAMARDWVAEQRQQDHIRLQHRNYFNSGVILLNLKKMREDNIAEKLLEDKKNDTFKRYMDQDAFNRVLYPHIEILNEKYNFHEEYDKLKLEDEKYSYLNTIDNVVCRHYTKYKPTQDLKFPHSEQFWQYGDVQDFMQICISNMRDDYGILLEHNRQLKRELEDVSQKVAYLQKNSFCRLFYKKSPSNFKIKFFGIPLFSISKKTKKFKVKLLGITLYKHTYKKEKDKFYFLSIPYKTKKIKDGFEIHKVFGITFKKKKTKDLLKIKEHNFLPNGIYECYSKDNLPSLKNGMLNIGILICGGFGDICIAANYLWYFRNKFKNTNIQLDVYVRNDFNMVKSVFKCCNFINRAFSTFHNGQYFEVSRNDIEYDLFIRIVRFPDILYKRNQRLESLDLSVFQYANIVEDFNLKYRSLYNNDRISAEFSLIRNQKRIQQPDIDLSFGIKTKFSHILPIFASKEEFFYNQQLLNKKYITIHREVDLRLPKDGTKLWEQENFEQVISLIKAKYPEIIFVQIGGNQQRSPQMDGVDKYLVGQISFEETKLLLKETILHIDCEGGFVHLQQALLREGKAVVLFGPTDPNFYGYDDNINICSNKCHPCENLSDTWFVNCMRINDNCICMKTITPKMVLDKIIPYLDKKINENENKCQLLSTEEAKTKGYKELYFSFDGIGDTLLFRSAIEKLAIQKKRKILIGTKRYELFKDSKWVDILYGYNESTFCKQQKQELENANIKPIFITGVNYLKDKELGWRRQWPKHHLLTSLCNKLGVQGKIEISGNIELSETEKNYGRFFEKNQIAIISKGMSEYKTIPLNVIQDVVNHLSDKYNFVQIGSEKDPLLANVLDKRGCSDLREAASILYNSDLFVGGIGGLMHLARFVETRSVVVYSHGEPQELVCYNCNENVYPKNYTCNDCGMGLKFPYQVKCDAGCIKEITAEEIVSVIEKQMTKVNQALEKQYEITQPKPVKGLEEFLKKHGEIKD